MTAALPTPEVLLLPLSQIPVDDVRVGLEPSLVGALTRAGLAHFGDVRAQTARTLSYVDGLTGDGVRLVRAALRRAERLASRPQPSATDLLAIGAGDLADLRFLLPGDLVRLAGPERAAVLEPFRAAAAGEPRTSPSDKNFTRHLGLLRRYAAEHGHTMPSRNEKFEGAPIGTWVSSQRTRHNLLGTMPVDRRLVLEAQPHWSWVAAGRGNAVRSAAEAASLLAEATAYAAEHGHTTPMSIRGPEIRLRRALARLREVRDHVAPDVQAAFDALPGWTWDENEAERNFDALREQRARDAVTVAKWDAPFSRLKAYVATHGDALVPRRYVDETGYTLGEWVAHMRRVRVDDWQRDALESLPGWDWAPATTRSHQKFDAALTRLKAYVAEHGALPRTDYRAPDGFGLGPWVARHRSRRSALAEQRVTALETVPGWTWTDPVATSRADQPHLAEHFEAMVSLLIDYLAEHGRLPSTNERYQGRGLGAWCMNKRSEKRDGTLHPDRIAALEKVDGWSWVVSAGRPRHRRG